MFDLYRRLLVTAIATYATVRTVSFVWRWQAFGRSGSRAEVVLQRYALTVLMGVRVRRFWFEFLQIGGLIALLWYLLLLHR